MKLLTHSPEIEDKANTQATPSTPSDARPEIQHHRSKSVDLGEWGRHHSGKSEGRLLSEKITGLNHEEGVAVVPALLAAVDPLKSIDYKDLLTMKGTH